MSKNDKHFPEDFMFRLTVGEKAELVAKCDHLAEEAENLRSQIATSSLWGGCEATFRMPLKVRV
jgi:hypothetical protein